MTVCPSCGAVNDEGRWAFDPEIGSRLLSDAKAERETCPGCERIEKGRVDGVVQLEGGFLNDHKEEAMLLIRSISEKKLKKNINSRIFHIEEMDDKLVIETTDRTLAERIGKEFEKAYSGNLTIQWQTGSDFARVYWQRD